MPSIFAIALKGLRALRVLIVLKMEMLPRPKHMKVCHYILYFVCLFTNNTCYKVDNRYTHNDEIQPAPGIAKVCHYPHCHQLETGLKEEDHRQDLIEVVEGVHQPRLGSVPHILQGHHKATQ